MKLLLLLLTATSLLDPILAYAIDPNSNSRLSLLARANPKEGEEPRAGPEPIAPKPEPEPKEPVVDGKPTTHQNIKAIIKNLPKQRWVTYLVSRAQAVGRLVGLRPKFTGDPRVLYEVNDFGYPMDPDPTDLTKQVMKLKEVRYSGGRMWTLDSKKESVEIDFHTGDILTTIVYKTRYFSPKEAISTLFTAQGDIPDINPGVQKRSDTLQTLNGQGGGSTGADSAQNPAAVFQQYLEALHTVQVNIGVIIAPVLNNITSQTNSTVIHQMAQSIYYDLTGSTTALMGPFNYGMSFLGKISNATTTSSTGQSINNTTTNGTASDTAKLYTTLESIYTAMWVKTLTAANSTGLFAQEVYLAGCLNTNDTSVYPPGFTAASKGGS